MNLSGKYVIDASNILEKAYMLVSVFLGSKEIFRLTSEDHKQPLSTLQEQFFERKISSLLIEIATSLRVLDDQFRGMNSDEEYYKSYKEALASVNMDAVILFNDADANLRWIYNKIIHSESFITFSREGVEAHETDYGYNGGMVDKKEVIWHHYDLHVRLAGTERKKEAGTWVQVPWHLLLNIVEFTNAIFTVLNAILIIKK